jgi:hypothetical protein
VIAAVASEGRRMSIVSVTRWGEVEGVLLVCGTRGVPLPEEWDGFLQAIEATTASDCLILSLGAVDLTQTQRDRAIEIGRRRKLRVFFVTDDFLMRRMVGVASWLGSDVRAFSWDELATAIEDMVLWPGKIERVLVAAVVLRDEVEHAFEERNPD